MADEIDVAAAAAEVEEVTVDGQTVTNRPLPDVIAADKYTTGKTALDGTDAAGRAKSGRSILRVGQFRAGGAV